MLSRFFFRFFGADSRSRGARAPWLVRSFDMFLYALAPLAQSYLFGLILGGVKRESQRS